MKTTIYSVIVSRSPKGMLFGGEDWGYEYSNTFTEYTRADEHWKDFVKSYTLEGHLAPSVGISITNVQTVYPERRPLGVLRTASFWWPKDTDVSGRMRSVVVKLVSQEVEIAA